MLSKVARNERLKMFASALNSSGVGISLAGIVLPILSVYFGVGQQLKSPDQLWILVAVSVFCVLMLQIVSYHILGALID